MSTDILNFEHPSVLLFCLPGTPLAAAAAAADLPAPFWCFQMCSFCAKLALLSCHARSALGLRSCHSLVFSYHIILVRIAFFSIPVICEAGSPVVRVKVVARLCRIRRFFAALSSQISSDNNEIRTFIRPCSYLIIL